MIMTRTYFDNENDDDKERYGHSDDENIRNNVKD